MKVVLLLLAIMLQDCGGPAMPQSTNEGNNRTAELTDPKRSEPPVKSENTMENSESKDIPKLDVKIKVVGDSLTLEYKVKNTTPTTIYLFNVLYVWDNSGTPVIDQHVVYSCLSGDGTLHLSKQILPLPRLKKVEVRRIPFTTKVLAGGEFGEKVSIKIPVEEYNPYFMKGPNSEVEPRAAESIFFSIQFIRESDQLHVAETNIPNAFSVNHPSLLSSVESIQSRPTPTMVKVEKRKDPFEAF